MNQNDVLRRLRFVLDLDDSQMMSLFSLGGQAVSRAEVSDWLKKDDDPAFAPLKDLQLAVFLNGLIVEKRGKRDGPQAVPEKRLTNNMIFMKLKIALDLKADDTLAILALGGFTISKHELSAFFRKPEHKHFRVCNDQVLRYFLKGLQLKYQPPNGAVIR